MAVSSRSRRSVDKTIQGNLVPFLLRHTYLPRSTVLPLAIPAAAMLMAAEWLTGPDVELFRGYLLLAIAVTWAGRAFDASTLVVAALISETALGYAHSVPLSGLSWGLFTEVITLGATIGIVRATRNAMRQLRTQARVDPLTGLLNTRAFESAAEAERSRAERAGGKLTVAFMDLDAFKGINDRYGHLMGDAVVKNFALCIAQSIRAYDIAGRLGGDEFVLLLPDTDEFAAAGVIERIRHRVDKTQGLPVVKATVGMVTFTTPPDSVREMIHQADELMYEAKRHGGDMVLGRLAGSSETDDDTVIEIDFSAHSHDTAGPPPAAAETHQETS